MPATTKKASRRRSTKKPAQSDLIAKSELHDPATEHDEAWSRARSYLEGVKLLSRLALAGRIILGHELDELKKTLGFTGSGRRKENPHAAGFKSLNRTWDQWCKAELGITYHTADRIIETYHAAKARIKRLGGQPRLLGLIETVPSKLDEEAHKTLAALVDGLEWGDSQTELLQEFRIYKRHASLTGGDTSQHQKPKGDTPGQRTFAFFHNIPESTSVLADSIGKIKSSPDYNTFLHSLDLTSSEPEVISLGSLEANLTATVADAESILRDIRKAKAAKLKSAQGT